MQGEDIKSADAEACLSASSLGNKVGGCQIQRKETALLLFLSPSRSLVPLVIIVKERIAVCMCVCVRAGLYFSCQSEPHGAAVDIRYNSLLYTRRLVMMGNKERGWMMGNAGAQLCNNNE